MHLKDHRYTLIHEGHLHEVTGKTLAAWVHENVKQERHRLMATPAEPLREISAGDALYVVKDGEVVAISQFSFADVSRRACP